MAEHQVMSCGAFPIKQVMLCYHSHNSYSRIFVSHPNLLSMLVSIILDFVSISRFG